MSPPDSLLGQQKEKYSQTFDEAHGRQVLSLIDEREPRREWQRERGGKLHSRHFVDFIPPPLSARTREHGHGIVLGLQQGNVSADVLIFDKCQPVPAALDLLKKAEGG